MQAWYNLNSAVLRPSCRISKRNQYFNGVVWEMTSSRVISERLDCRKGMEAVERLDSQLRNGVDDVEIDRPRPCDELLRTFTVVWFHHLMSI